MFQISNSQSKGFTILELLIATAILVVVGTISIPSITYLTRTPQLDGAFGEVISKIRLAQNKTLSSEGNSQYGVYFNTTPSPHQYVLFKGSSWATRIIASDQTYSVPGIVEFSAVNTGGGGNQIVFDRLTGSTTNSGDVSLRLKSDSAETRTFYIDNSGVIGLTALSVPNDTRVKDSRHIDFNYSRTIDTALESIILIFNSVVVETIPINTHLVNGQIYWEGTVVAGGSNQKVTLHTITLNDPSAHTQFSVFRDRRFNDKSLEVKISADITGSLLKYSADGLTVNGLTSSDCSSGALGISIFTSNCLWQ